MRRLISAAIVVVVLGIAATAGGFPTVRPFGSGHRGVTQAAFVDGSVHSFTTSTNPEVLEALATIAGGEKIAPLDD
jgi:hypothetical protein